MSQPNSLSYGDNDTFLTEGLDKEAQIEALGNINKKDSDSDGLKDWEEALWNTDPQDSDTDDDGTKDGEEVELGRNPTIAGPDDKYQDDPIIRKANPNVSNELLSETDKFSQDFLQNYLSLYDSNGPLNENDKNNLINISIEDIVGKNISITNYTQTDLNISQNIDSVSVKKYGNTLGEIILKHSFETEDELTIFNRSVTNDDTREIEKLDPIINGYKNILKDSLALSVPVDAINEHITFVQSIASVTESIEGMRVIYTDPVRAIAGIGSYGQSTKSLKDAFDKMGSYFTNKGIIFSKYDKGYVVVNVI
ncbi:MAG: hypothetical protein ISR98_01775 [Parcubacteria group bacterium]|nr:hypothetical protein [Parcubacteria group bacterium]